MQQISAEQIKVVLALIYQANVPIQVYDKVSDIFNKLPLITKEDEATNTK